jgi:hypothetical protein
MLYAFPKYAVITAECLMVIDGFFFFFYWLSSIM